MSNTNAELTAHQREVADKTANALEDFAALAEELCGVIEDLDNLETYDFLVLLDYYFPAIYAASRRLPQVAEWFLSPYEDDWDLPAEPEDDSDETTELRQDLVDSLEERLGDFNWYRGVIDPYEHMMTTDPEDALVPVLTLSLAADISELDWLLRNRLRAYRNSGPDAVVQSAIEWRYAFDGPTGSHVTAAVRAIWSLVNDHAEDLWVDLSDEEAERADEEAAEVEDEK